MKILVIGAGISGLIAEGAFRGEDVTVCDPKISSAESNGHTAVMRLRDESVGKYVRCSLEEITAHKAVYFQGKLHNEANIMMNNLYSLKAYETLGDRSLGELGAVKRYLITKFAGDIHSGHLGCKVSKISADSVEFDNGESERYDVIISTIPMPSLLRMVDLGVTTPEFEWNSVFVSTAHIKIHSTVHQTIYFPSNNDSPYRATIEGQRFIVESMEEISEFDLYHCLEKFGLNEDYICNITSHAQDIGKILPINDIVRRRIMGDLTNKFRIYSFGRFAVWKPLRVDQTLDDIEKIKRLISVGNENYYSDA